MSQPWHGDASAVVTLTFAKKTAVTPECGDWSENLVGNRYNTEYPNFGCAQQNNIAAMVSNPDDFQRPRTMPPASSASQQAAVDKYNSGEWTKPTVTFGASDLNSWGQSNDSSQ